MSGGDDRSKHGINSCGELHCKRKEKEGRREREKIALEKKRIIVEKEEKKVEKKEFEKRKKKSEEEEEICEKKSRGNVDYDDLKCTARKEQK